MLDKIDLSKEMDAEETERILKSAGEKLGRLQRECKQEEIPVVIVFEGVPAAGKGVGINRLIQEMDPRGFTVYAQSVPSREEALRPPLWRYWVRMPERGRIAIFDESWYNSAVKQQFSDICSFEKQLYDDGTILIKFFLYIDKKEQKKRFRRLEESKETAWRVTPQDWKINKHFDEYLTKKEQMLEATDTQYAPWTLVPAMKKKVAAAKIIATVCERMEGALAAKKQHRENQLVERPPITGEVLKNDVLSGIDLGKSLTKQQGKEELDFLQKKLERLHSDIYRRRIPVVIGFEGWDAAGKGGAIRRLTSHLDPRGYQVNPIAAPNDIEKKHHYLWRFYNQMPKAGHIAIFDRTWYGRVLVERIEGFCTQEEWSRAYGEINEMERHLANAGAVVLKFWLHIDKDEQEARFKARMADPAKQWKITQEDWRNREKWEQYEAAVNEMLIRTSTTYAPWIVVEGNSKEYARVKVLQTVVDALEAALKK